MRVDAKLTHCPELFRSDVPAGCVRVKKTSCLATALASGLARAHTSPAQHLIFPSLSSPILPHFIPFSQVLTGATLYLLPSLFHVLYPSSGVPSHT